MELADIAEKIANNTNLTPEELNFWKLSMRQSQINNAFISGLQNGSSNMALNVLTANKISVGYQSVGNIIGYFSSNTQVIPNNTTTMIPSWVTENVPHSNFSINSSYILVPETGYYLVTMNAIWDTNATGVRKIHGIIGGVSNFMIDVVNAMSGDETYQRCVTSVYYISSGHSNYVNVFQNSGADLEVGVGLTFLKISDKRD